MSKIEGTVQIGGLFEGPFTTELDGPLQGWRRQCKQAGIDFDISTDGALFSMIPHREAFAQWRGSKPVHEAIATALEQLLQLLEPDQRRHCMSTLRCAEILPGAERQSIFTLGMGGTLHVEQREVPTDTQAPPELENPAFMRRQLLYAAGILLLTFLISLPFVPYKAWVQRGIANITRVAPEDIILLPSPFDDVLENVALTWDPPSRTYRLFFNLSAEDLMQQWAASETPRGKLAAEDLIRGRVRLEFLDEGQTRLGEQVYRIRDTGDIESENESPPATHYIAFPPTARIRYLRFLL